MNLRFRVNNLLDIEAANKKVVNFWIMGIIVLNVFAIILESIESLGFQA